MKMAAACVVDHPCVSECPTSRPGTAVSSAIHDVIQEAVLAACRPPTSSRLIAQSSDDILEEQRPTTASVVDDVLYSILDAAARPTTSSSHRPSTSTIHTVRLHHHPHNAPRSLAHPGDITLALASCDEDVSQHASNGQPQGAWWWGRQCPHMVTHTCMQPCYRECSTSQQHLMARFPWSASWS